MTDNIGYGTLIEEAMLNVVKGALKHIAKNGLEGEHHFYITFLTTAPNVSIPETLLEHHPQAMTIVLQNQFWDLVVEKEYFSVDLSFNKRQETLKIPYDALLSFDDPSVKFSLHFNSSDYLEDEPIDMRDEDDSDIVYNKDNVVSLADFKKNKLVEKDANKDD